MTRTPKRKRALKQWWATVTLEKVQDYQLTNFNSIQPSYIKWTFRVVLKMSISTKLRLRKRTLKPIWQTTEIIPHISRRKKQMVCLTLSWKKIITFKLWIWIKRALQATLTWILQEQTMPPKIWAITSCQNKDILKASNNTIWLAIKMGREVMPTVMHQLLKTTTKLKTIRTATLKTYWLTTASLKKIKNDIMKKCWSYCKNLCKTWRHRLLRNTNEHISKLGI